MLPSNLVLTKGDRSVATASQLVGEITGRPQAWCWGKLGGIVLMASEGQSQLLQVVVKPLNPKKAVSLLRTEQGNSRVSSGMVTAGDTKGAGPVVLSQRWAGTPC